MRTTHLVQVRVEAHPAAAGGQELHLRLPNVGSEAERSLETCMREHCQWYLAGCTKAKTGGKWAGSSHKKCSKRSTPGAGGWGTLAGAGCRRQRRRRRRAFRWARRSGPAGAAAFNIGVCELCILSLRGRHGCSWAALGTCAPTPKQMAALARGSGMTPCHAPVSTNQGMRAREMVYCEAHPQHVHPVLIHGNQDTRLPRQRRVFVMCCVLCQPAVVAGKHRSTTNTPSERSPAAHPFCLRPWQPRCPTPTPAAAGRAVWQFPWSPAAAGR